MEMTHSTGDGGHAICIIMTLCIQKSICDLPKATVFNVIENLFRQFVFTVFT